ncbi:LCP family protein [Planomonospora corallina]|uniref:LCP family protein n=1 Tax=Planomonospora corallina TaxID=1806052 RepID=A0ABV8HYG3_9ACTN
MRDRSTPPGIGAVIGWTALSVIAPGAAHLRAGWRRTGLVLLSVHAVALLALLWVGLTSDLGVLAGQLVASSWLTVLTAGALALGVAWFALVVHSFMVLEPGRLPAAGQAAAGTVAGVLAVAVLLPFGLAGQYAAVSQAALDDVFAPALPPPGGSGDSGGEQDPWADRTRVNILLLGGDADDHRPGVRTDSINVASIDVKTGNTVLFSLPRNLENVRFVPGSPMARRFPNGFRLPAGPGGGREDLLFAVWEYADAHPEIFGGRQGQGARVLIDTVGYTLGLKIDWYALVNMWGFARLIDAIGGVTVTVPHDVVFGKYNEGVVKAGTRRLGGADAMWFARSRTYSDDFSRMGRQRCVLGALLRQADPATVLARFNRIALATKELIRTDIPRPMLEHLVPLALKVKSAEVTSVQFVPPLINTGYPDWAKIRTVTARAIQKSVSAPAAAVSSPDGAPGATPSAAPAAGAGAKQAGGPAAEPPTGAGARRAAGPVDPAAPKDITDGCG